MKSSSHIKNLFAFCYEKHFLRIQNYFSFLNLFSYEADYFVLLNKFLTSS